MLLIKKTKRTLGYANSNNVHDEINIQFMSKIRLPILRYIIVLMRICNLSTNDITIKLYSRINWALFYTSVRVARKKNYINY